MTQYQFDMMYVNIMDEYNSIPNKTDSIRLHYAKQIALLEKTFEEEYEEQCCSSQQGKSLLASWSIITKAKSKGKGVIIIKKIISMLALGAIILICSGCASKANEPVSETEINHEQYMTTGRYYINGNVITHDGNIWDYQTEIISDEPSYDNEPVYVVFDNNGTETDIYDDAVIGLILDVRTAIYDELETELSKDFVIERDGNNIRITAQK